MQECYDLNYSMVLVLQQCSKLDAVTIRNIVELAQESQTHFYLRLWSRMLKEDLRGAIWFSRYPIHDENHFQIRMLSGRSRSLMLSVSNVQEGRSSKIDYERCYLHDQLGLTDERIANILYVLIEKLEDAYPEKETTWQHGYEVIPMYHDNFLDCGHDYSKDRYLSIMKEPLYEELYDFFSKCMHGQKMNKKNKN